MAERRPSKDGAAGLSAHYCRSLGAAEEAVAVAVDQILTEGGFTLWQKYLERKAFGYAAEAATEAVVSSLTMCFVAHDAGEPPFSEEWDLEEEPEPSQIDSWARMHLPMRRLEGNSAAPGTGLSIKARSTNRGGNAIRSRTSDLRPRSKEPSHRAGKTAPAESRALPIPDESQLDEEEEALRELKAQEEGRKREKDKKGREVEKTNEEERKQVLARHEEMRLRQHTFDQDGNVIWVEELKLERLPKVQESAVHSLKKDAKSRTGNLDAQDTLRSTQDPPGSSREPPKDKRRGGQGKNSTAKPRKGPADEYADGFSKLQHGQPPILETMVVQTGVSLEAMGKKKNGGYSADERITMTRKEYNRLAAGEGAGGATDYRGASAGHGGNSARGGTAGGAREAGLGDDVLGPMDGGRTGGRSASAPSLRGPDSPPVQRAPPAPPPGVRHMGKKFEALGHLAFNHAPRYHQPRLGGPTGSALPPLGASMGHGLVRHGSLKEDYSPLPHDLPSSIVRSTSEASLVSGRRQATPKGALYGGSSKASLKELGRDSFEAGDSQDPISGHGRMKSEASPAYRNFRKALLPGENTGASGPPGISTGFGGRFP